MAVAFAAWNASDPAGDTYTVQVSTSQSDFANPVSSNTVNLNAVLASLNVNTTYYGHVRSTYFGVDSVWSANVTTATLANQPASAASTWTAVNYTSVTVQWADNGNPAGTLYTIELSSAAGFPIGGISGTRNSGTTTASAS